MVPRLPSFRGIRPVRGIRLPAAGTGLPVLLLALLGLASDSLAPSAAAGVPAYAFTQGRTNAFRVTLETTHLGAPVVISGVVLQSMSAGPAGFTHLSFQGRLLPRAAGPGSQGRPMPMGMGFGPGGPAFGWIPRVIHVLPGTVVTVDARGMVVRDAADPSGLPAPFDSLGALLVEALPAGLDEGLSLDAEVELEDELPMAVQDSPSPPYFGRYPGRRLPRLAVTRTGTVRVAEQTGSSLVLTSRVEWVSHLRSGGEPRLAASIQRRTVVDPLTGALSSSDIEGTTTLTTEEIRMRRPVRIEVRRLEAEERERELRAQESGSEPPAPVDAAELSRLTQDFDSGDAARRGQAVARLQGAEIEVPTAVLMGLAVKLATDPDLAARMAGQRLLGLYGGAAEVPAMIQALNWGESGGYQRPLIEGLRRVRDPRAVEALANVVARGVADTDFAAECLRVFGAAAEPAALGLLRERHAVTRRLACELLGHVGTESALEPLRAQVLDPDSQVNQAAGSALRAIQSRLPAAVAP